MDYLRSIFTKLFNEKLPVEKLALFFEEETKQCLKTFPVY